MNKPKYGQLDDLTFQIERTLPGPIERVWRYLVESDLRQTWLASGTMPGEVGSKFTLTWRNDELTNPPGKKPDGFGKEHQMESKIVEWDPPHRVTFTWHNSDHVTFALAAKDEGVLLTVTHRRLRDRNLALMVSAGWHAHLDLLAAQLADRSSSPFWDEWTRLHGEYADMFTS